MSETLTEIFTCDDNCDDPCPRHDAENKLQDSLNRMTLAKNRAVSLLKSQRDFLWDFGKRTMALELQKSIEELEDVK